MSYLNSQLSGLTIVLIGPTLNNPKSSYGGGMGGVIIATSRILNGLNNLVDDHNVRLVEYSTRSKSRHWRFNLIFRLIFDCFKVANSLWSIRHHNAIIVHIIADAGLSVVRNCSFVIIAKIFSKKVITDVRGNALVAFANGKDGICPTFLWKTVLQFSDYVFVQSVKTETLLCNRYSYNKVQHLPNFVCVNDFPVRVDTILQHNELKVIFVGFCIREKGVFDVLDGCKLASQRGISISLTFVGEEKTDFKNHLDAFKAPPALKIQRMGKSSRRDTLTLMSKADIFLFPTYWTGEGHPNVINEAMMSKLAIICTRAGVIDEILDENIAYFVPFQSAIDIADRLDEINSNRHDAIIKANRCHSKVLELFSDKSGFEKILRSYVS